MRNYEDKPIDYAPVYLVKDKLILTFIVPGRPVPKGNVIKGRWGGYHDPTKGLGDWVALIQAQARNAMWGEWRRRSAGLNTPGTRYGTLDPFTGPVAVGAEFVMRRPTSLPKSKTPPAVKKPDLDKLLRAVFDGMTGIVFHDDSQVTHIVDSSKRTADYGETPGVVIAVEGEPS